MLCFSFHAEFNQVWGYISWGSRYGFILNLSIYKIKSYYTYFCWNFLLSSFVIPSFKGCNIGKLKWNANVVRIWFFNYKHASITFMSIYDIFSSYVMSIYSYIMQGMLMTPTNPAYLYALQNRTLLLVCRMHLCFPISTFQLTLLQNHPFLVSGELLKVAILLYSACTVFCLFLCRYTTFDVTYLGWHSTLKSAFVFWLQKTGSSL